jgi:hypothetical protein
MLFVRAHTTLLLLVALLSADADLVGAARAQSAQPPGAGVQLQPIGKIESAKGTFTITHVDGVLLQANLGPGGGPKAGDPVFQRDVIETAADGSVGLALNDGTAFSVSPSAKIVLDELVYDPKSTSNSSLISLTKGTFTFIAGKVAKTGNMRVQTPAATMGIRGTAPRVAILPDGSVRFSTLVEEYLKNNGGGTAPTEPGGRSAPLKQRRVMLPDRQPRQARNDAESAALDRLIEDQNSAVGKKLGICKGC